MKMLKDFAIKLGGELFLDPSLTVEKAGRYYLLSRELQNLVREEFYYAGIYLGKVKKRLFFPSFNFLAMLAKRKANSIVVDKKAAWLFICGRDVFRRSILVIHGEPQKGDYALVLNEFDDCLGFGRLLCSLDTHIKANRVVMKNIADLGDFLRRES